MAKLKAENAQLKSEVDAWKSKLTAAEVANGKKVICSGPVKKSGGAEPEPAKEEFTEKKEEKEAKVQKDQKYLLNLHSNNLRGQASWSKMHASGKKYLIARA